MIHVPSIPQRNFVRTALLAFAMCIGLNGAQAAAPFVASDCPGDGQTDATACLQRAIDASRSAVLPPGRKFLVTSSIIVTGPKTLDGNGSAIVTDEQINVVTIHGSDVKIRGLTAESRTNVRAQGIMLADDAANIELRDNRVIGKFRVGILFGGPGEHDITLVGNTIAPGPDGRIGYGVLVNPARLARNSSNPPRNIVFRKNTISEAWGDAIEINSPPPAIVSGLIIDSNTLSAPYHPSGTAGFCIGIAGAINIRITGNKLSNCKWQGIHLEHSASNVLVADNVIDKTIGPAPLGLNAAGVGITGRRHSSGILLLNTNHVKIYNNQIRNTYNAGIDLVWNPIGANTYITIAGNTIVNPGDYGVHVDGPLGRDLNISVGSMDGYKENHVINPKVAAYAGCVSSIRGSNARMWTCGSP